MGRRRKKGELRERTQEILNRIGAAMAEGLNEVGRDNLLSNIRAACERGETSWEALKTSEKDLEREIPLISRRWSH